MSGLPAGGASRLPPPDEIDDYLAALNAALAVGLRSRIRIMGEVEGHLRETADARLAGSSPVGTNEGTTQAGGRGTTQAGGQGATQAGGPAEDGTPGETPADARRRAIAAFGTPQEVAAGFQTGLLGALDGRLARIDRRIEPHLANVLLRGAGFAVCFAAIGATIAGVGVLFDRPYPLAASQALFIVAALGFGVHLALVLSRRLRLRDGLAMRGLPNSPVFLRFLGWVDVPMLVLIASVWLTTTPGGGGIEVRLLTIAIPGVAYGEALLRRATGANRRNGCADAYVRDPDAHWRSYAHRLWISAAFGTCVILTTADPLSMGAVLATLLLVLTAVVTVVRRLAWNSLVRRRWACGYEQRRRSQAA